MFRPKPPSKYPDTQMIISPKVKTTKSITRSVRWAKSTATRLPTSRFTVVATMPKTRARGDRGCPTMGKRGMEIPTMAAWIRIRTIWDLM